MNNITRREDIIFRAYKENLLSLIEEAGINVDFNIKLEVTAMLYALGDFIMRFFDSTTGEDRRNFIGKVGRYSSNDDFSYEEFDKRSYFYRKIIDSDIAVRAEFINHEIIEFDPDNKRRLLGDPFWCCAVAFGDILINPLCFNDYENAPLSNIEALDEIMFAETTSLSIVTLVNKYTKEMTEYCESFELLASPSKQPQCTVQKTNNIEKHTQITEQTANNIKETPKKFFTRKRVRDLLIAIAVIGTLFLLPLIGIIGISESLGAFVASYVIAYLLNALIIKLTGKSSKCLFWFLIALVYIIGVFNIVGDYL